MIRNQPFNGDVPIRSHCLPEVFFARASEHSGKTAIFWGDTQITYGQLADSITRIATALTRTHGVRPGECVGLWHRNAPEFVAAYYGILAAGAVVVPINNFLKPAEIEHIIRDAGLRLIISEPELIAAASELAEKFPDLKLLPVADASDAAPSTSDFASRVAGDLAVIIYTSGTTGRSKGAMLTHGNLLHNVASCASVLEAAAADQ